MKNKNKTIIEGKNGSLSKKIGRLAVIVVLYIAIVSTLAFIMSTITLIVNADSIVESPDYQYMKESYYNWDSITWSTVENNYVTGSNDTFSSETEFIDYYSINISEPIPSVPTNLVGYTILVPSGWTPSYLGLLSITGYFTINGVNTNFRTSDSIGIWDNFVTFYYNNSDTVNNYPDTSLNFTVTGGSGSSNSNFIQWLVNNEAIFQLTQNSRAISSSDYSFLIERNNVYNDSLSSIDTFVYDSVLNTDLIFNSIVFEKNNYFLKVGDLNRIGVPMISASVLNGGYNISFDIEGYRKDSEGNITNLSIVTNSRVDVLGYQFLYPSKSELFGNIDNLNDNDMLYIKNLRVLVEFPNNYVDNLSYRYGVDSIEKNSLDYDIAFSSWVNQSGIANIGNDLLSSVNGFLAFELVPGLSLMSILILLVVIPLLIWILRLFLGG